MATIRALAAAVALVALPARADLTSWRIGFAAAEILTPDFRLELAPGSPARGILSWPVGPFALNVEWPPFDPETHDEYLSSWVDFEVVPFIEPQLVLGAGVWRGLAGARVAGFYSSSGEEGYTRPGLLLEGGGLWGQDGSGGFAGFGVTVALIPALAIPTASFVYRAIFAGGALRHELSIDFQLLFPEPPPALRYTRHPIYPLPSDREPSQCSLPADPRGLTACKTSCEDSTTGRCIAGELRCASEGACEVVRDNRCTCEELLQPAEGAP